MANKKTSSSASAKKQSTAKKNTAKKVTTKATPKRVEAKKVVETKAAVKKDNKLVSFFRDNYVIIGLVIIAILLIVNIIIVVNGHKVKLSKGNEVIASVKGKEFTAETLFDTLKEKHGNDELLNLVDEVIVKKELSNKDKLEAKNKASENVEQIRKQYEEYGYKWEDVLAQYGYASEDALLDEFTLTSEKEMVVNKYLKNELTDKEIKKYYDENVFGTYTAKHILITPDTNDDMSEEEVAAAEEDAKNRAQEVIDKLNQGENWEDLVKEYSEDEGSKEDNGLIENFTKGDVVDAFWDAVVELKDGKYSGEPVKSDYGYHVIRRDSYQEKESLKKMKSKLIDEIIEKKLSEDQKLYTNTWAKIRKKYNFEIKDTVIKNAYEKTLND